MIDILFVRFGENYTNGSEQEAFTVIIILETMLSRKSILFDSSMPLEVSEVNVLFYT